MYVGPLESVLHAEVSLLCLSAHVQREHTVVCRCVCVCVCIREFQVQVIASVGIKSCFLGFKLVDLQNEASFSSYDSFHLPRRLPGILRSKICSQDSDR